MEKKKHISNFQQTTPCSNWIDSERPLDGIRFLCILDNIWASDIDFRPSQLVLNSPGSCIQAWISKPITELFNTTSRVYIKLLSPWGHYHPRLSCESREKTWLCGLSSPLVFRSLEAKPTKGNPTSKTSLGPVESSLWKLNPARAVCSRVKVENHVWPSILVGVRVEVLHDKV